MEDIDIVVLWVDGDDPAWRAEKRRYDGSASDASDDVDVNSDRRFRDGGLLKYWFRSIDKFAPWAHRVFFVTCGQKPDWLDESNPRLRLVNHKDYIPAEYLPTFHSNTIELNLHRIPDISEHFVLFNDDDYILRPVPPEFFFRDGLPVIPCDLATPPWLGRSNISHIVRNNARALNKELEVKRLILRNFGKFINLRALGPVRAAKNIVSFATSRTYVPGMFGHRAQPHLKSTFAELWRRLPDEMDRTSRNRFRGDDCINQWLACAWNMVSGNFFPTNEKYTNEYVGLDSQSLDYACRTIKSPKVPLLSINDKVDSDDSAHCFETVALALSEVFPEKSSFER